MFIFINHKVHFKVARLNEYYIVYTSVLVRLYLKFFFEKEAVEKKYNKLFCFIYGVSQMKFGKNITRLRVN